ncbi:hypothetical protein B0T14DRAFT_425283 [Immersiella caudata]|uniref:Uncharacterized protein n=1 Tax=Immersiella caudata TaxID=314043 RepID=A0AA39WWA6_9PEZI|nr:hypothetical protein B0T14DRAFT_425283 [Immersiella caudata]
MDQILPMGGLPLPGFQRRLSRLYNDTKKSSDFVKEPVQHAEADPEIKSLHRKLRIQKDRLVSWGLEWSDPNQSSAEILIDSSLSKAGLSEVVGSIMSTIKDILAEAEPLWHSSRRLAGERVGPDSAPRRGEKIQLVVWDKSRFEDLVRDLTTSIDTLYDLSRTRSSYAQTSAAARERLSKPSVSVEDLRPFESSRIQTPQQIDPKTLTNLRAMQAVPMTELAERERPRDVVFMDRQAYAELTSSMGGRHPHAPLLLEYATFDSIYSMTGISPPMDRFGKLSQGLSAESQRSPASWTGLPHLLGFFEDMESSRFGLVYQFPKTFNPVTFEHLTQNPLYNLCSLADLLARPDFEPKLEAKFRLAANLANTVFDMHARGITHGNLVDENVSFCNAVGTDPEVSGITQGEVDIRRPLVSSFDLFSDPQSQDEPRTFSLYKHALDPRNSAQSPLTNNADSKCFDLYSLAMILLSVGLWTKLENLVADPANPVISESVLEQLSIRCGTLYMKAVQACWNAVDQEMTGFRTTEQIVSRVEFKASRYLEACCILDGVSNLDERLGDDLGEARPPAVAAPEPSAAGPSTDAKAEKSAGEKALTRQPSAASQPTAAPAEPQAEVQDASETPAKSSAKMRLYPQIPLGPDIVDKWNRVIMPQINSALRHFFRKNPESVEISLESIGESPQLTKPTVLVVCTSVSKVRAILKKKLGELFGGEAGLGLKVCRGQVVRSRKEQRRSMAHPDDGDDGVFAANPGYQEKPTNGASIGAWIGNRHLRPVSFGGLIIVDDKPYGMTVHHMLDDPDQDISTRDVSRSMAGPEGLPDLNAWYAEQYANPESDPDSSGSEDYTCEFSDSDSDSYSDSAITSEYSESDDEDEGEYAEAGDIPGVEPGCGGRYIITQPALDDVPDDFYPNAETQDEDHNDTYGLGEMYASSGIRRRTINGLLHEIDWALFEFKDERQPGANLVPRAESPSSSFAKKDGKAQKQRKSSILQPTSVTPTSELSGLEVQCVARTSGLQTGQILQTVASVKIYGRTSPSQIYQVSGTPPKITDQTAKKALPMGIPGDSGAWVMERDGGRVCGHVLAWSQRKRVAYICPMDVLLLDIAETLEAAEIKLPGGEVVVGSDGYNQKRMSRVVSSAGRNTGIGGPYLASQHRTEAGEEADDDDSYDEGVDVDLAHDLKELHLAGTVDLGPHQLGY